jgi:drug/metabolite transporter (DMT)-like permease
MARSLDPPPMAETLPLRRALLAFTLLILTIMMWAGNATASKLAVGHVSPLTLTFLRWTMAVAILLPLNLGRLRAEAAAIRANWPALAAMGALGYTGFNLLLYSAAATTTAINITILQSGMPLIIFLLNLAVFSVAITWQQLVGYAVTLVGVVLVATQGAPARLLELELRQGDAFMLLASVLYASYTVALKRTTGLHPLTLLTVLSIAAFATSIPFAAAEHLNGAALWPATPYAWGIITYTAVCAAVLSQWFFMQGVAILGPNRAGLFMNLIPVFGALFAVLILGEVMAGYQMISLILVLSGIFVAQRSMARD